MTSSVDIDSLTLAQLAAELVSGEISAVQAIEYYLSRIENIDRNGPALNAVREINPAALQIAQRKDEVFLAGDKLGPLHGVPILLKDNMAVSGGMATSGGSLALADLRPDIDSGVAQRLIAAGAIILGKANLTEFADYLGGEMPSEFSSAGGVVKHPYGGRYDRGGGSSIGPACAVAAGLCAAAVGSETQNSLQAPAGESGVVAIKPTVGLVSRAGIVPLAMSQDTAGPMGRTVADAAALLGPMAGVDPADSITLTGAAYALTDYCQFLDANALAGARIGVARNQYFGRVGHEQAEAVVEHAIEQMRLAGAVIVDPADIPIADELAEVRSSVFPTEFKAGLNHFLAVYGQSAAVSSLADVIAFNEAHTEQCLQYGQGLAINAQASAGLNSAAYQADRLRDITLSRVSGIDAAMEQYQLDALITPASAAAKLTGKAGYPVVTVPAGFTDDGQPVGISFIGGAWQEPRLIALAYAFEQTGTYRRNPDLG